MQNVQFLNSTNFSNGLKIKQGYPNTSLPAFILAKKTTVFEFPVLSFPIANFFFVVLLDVYANSIIQMVEYSALFEIFSL